MFTGWGTYLYILIKFLVLHRKIYLLFNVLHKTLRCSVMVNNSYSCLLFKTKVKHLQREKLLITVPDNSVYGVTNTIYGSKMSITRYTKSYSVNFQKSIVIISGTYFTLKLFNTAKVSSKVALSFHNVMLFFVLNPNFSASGWNRNKFTMWNVEKERINALEI